MKIKNLSMLLTVLCLANCSLFYGSEESLVNIKSTQDLVNLFPKSVEEMKARAAALKTDASKHVDEIIKIEASQRTYANTVTALDRAAYSFSCGLNPLSFLERVSTDAQIRNASHELTVELENFAIDVFSNNEDLYRAFKEYVQGNASKEQLNSVQKRFIDETLKDFKRSGLDLPADKKPRAAALNKELSELAQEFAKNIEGDNRTLSVTLEELKGVPADFIEKLLKTDDHYALRLDTPTSMVIFGQCDVEATRKKYYELYNQRAYPINIKVLDSLIAKRDEYARLLDFKSYADYDLDNQMAHSVDRVQKFIADLYERAAIKAEQENKQFMSHLPQGVSLTSDGKIKPWDFGYIVYQLKKIQYNVDEEAISHYFPMEETIKGLISIFEQFMSLTIKEQPIDGLWHKDVKMLQVYDQGGKRLRGYIIFDLFPRDNKFYHFASFDMIKPIKVKDYITPAVNIVVGNFPRPSAERPSLLKHNDVTTFFHEFGHAIHDLLGGCEIAAFAGYSVKTDFVELPSQMLERWMWDKEMLKKVSHHYKTGNPLPDALIDKKIELKNLSVGNMYARQMFLSRISLDYFLEGAHKDTDAILRQLYVKFMPRIALSNKNHFQTSFGHLAGYDAKYYSYAWSEVFAADIFARIKEAGLLNPEIGQKYVNTILAPGGSVDPNELLKNFLGREPNSDAFFNEMGLSIVPQASPQAVYAA